MWDLTVEVAALFHVLSGIIEYTWSGLKTKDTSVSNPAPFLGAVLGIVGCWAAPTAEWSSYLFCSACKACVRAGRPENR
ncbi:hypothetical protein [Nocardia sp. NPDC051463]|uniref:hypothetical protein n=1 Tax=Nocardia sp. NPDC051463 TaxID=3154845 RepID=UPI0034309AC5